jgi:hypothetical protein
VYVLGFGVHPHQVGYACAVAACYVILTGIATFFTQRAWRVQARLAAARAARPADGPGTEANAGAPGTPGVGRVSFRSLLWASLWVTALGAAMLTAFFVLVNHYEGSAMALESTGVQVEGVITSVTGQGDAPADGAVDVQYVYAGQTFDKHIYRDDNSPTYQVGESVVVTLDPSDPQVATVGGSDNQAPGVVWLLVALLVVGGGAVVCGAMMLIATSLTRRKSRRTTVPG